MNPRASRLFEEHQNAIYRRTDRLFATLMVLEYLAGIAAALTISPKTWSGSQSSIHIHVLAAVFLGAIILSLPIALAFIAPGRAVTRHVIAVAQMLDSALLIHLTGGRLETHFHIFGSLAFLAFYRDWRVLISASSVVAIDHYFRGVYWPQSVYGILSSSPFRWIEHTGWVIFEDIFIVLACHQSILEMKEIAEKRALLEQVAQERADTIAELETTKTQLNEALRAKTSFMSICGHELNTPLTSLSLQNQLTQRALQKGETSLFAPERVAAMMARTGEQVTRLLRLVEDMLDHSRIHEGKLMLQPERVELSALVEEVVERYRPQAESMGCAIGLEKRYSPVGRWDKFRIEQVVTNLVSNAIKYGAGKPIAIALDLDDAMARITVRDHGIGIAKENHSKIFDQFERVSHSNHVSGLGLGLYITKNIVNEHGGTITVESELDQGTRFVVSLPIGSA